MSKKKLQNEKPKQQNAGFCIAVILIVCSYIVSIVLIVCTFCTKAEIANNNLYNSLGILRPFSKWCFHIKLVHMKIQLSF